MQIFLKKLIGFSVGPVAAALISFITIPVTTYFISPTEFGKASMFTVVQGLVMTFIYIGMDQSYTKEYHYVSDKRKLFQSALILPFCISLIMTIIIIIFNSSFSELLFDSTRYGYLANLFSVMIIFATIERFILLSIRMEERAIEYSIFSIFIKLMIFIVTITLISLGDRTFKTIVYATVFGQVFGDVILIIKNKDLFYLSMDNFDKALIKKMLIFGFPLIIAVSLSNLMNTSGRFFLRGYSTYYELGIYTAAIKIAALIQIIQVAFTSFWVPTAYRWNKEKREMKNFSFVSDVLLLIMTIMFFLVLLLKKYIVFILSTDYSDAQFIIGLVAIPPILYTLSETTTLGIVFSGKSYINIWISILALVPNILINILLTPKLGTVGAAFATAVSFVIFCFARTYFSRKCGFKIDFGKQTIAIFLFFLAACINCIHSSLVGWITIGLFILTIIVQYQTFNKIMIIYKNPTDWNFE